MDPGAAGQLAQLAQERLGTEPQPELDRLEQRRLGAGPARSPVAGRQDRLGLAPARQRDVVRRVEAAQAVAPPAATSRRCPRPRAGAGRRGRSRATPRRPGASRPWSGRPPARDQPARLLAAPRSVRWRAAASGASWRFSRASAGDGGVDLGDHRGHPGDEEPLLGLADGVPAAVDRPAGVGDVAAPQRERGGREVVRAGQLGLADGVELQDRLAEQPRRRLAGVRLDLDDRQLQDAGEVDDADRQPAHRALGRRRAPPASGRAGTSVSATLPARKLP